MVTKVSSTVYATVAELPFSPDMDNTSALNFGIKGGVFSRAGVTTTIAAQQIGLTDNSTNIIYLDTNLNSVEVATSGSEPAINAVRMYSVVTASGVISSFIDQRRRSPAETGPADDLRTFLINLQCEHLWLMEDEAIDSQLADSGTAATLDLAETGGAPVYENGGPTFDTEGIEPTGTGRHTDATAANGGTTGSVGWFFNMQGVTPAASMGVLTVDSADETDNITFGTGGKGAGASIDQAFSVVFTDAGSIANYRVVETDVATVEPDFQWHSVVITQDGTSDGTGILIYYDGALQTTQQITGGTAPAGDTWFANNITPTDTSINGDRTGSNNNTWLGDLGPVFICRNDVLTATQILDMHQLMVLNDTLHFWKFADTTASGNAVDDGNSLEATTPNDGTQENGVTAEVASIITGVSDTCMEFDGSDDQIELAGSILTQTRAGTVHAWIELDAGWSAQGNIMAFSGDEVSLNQRVVLFNVQAGRELAMDIRANGTGQRSFSEVSTPLLSTGTIHHVAITCDGILANEKLFYIDGSVISGANVATTTTGALSPGSWVEAAPGANDWGTLGANRTGSSGNTFSPFFGKIQHLTVLRRVLLASEISTIWTDGM